ncbi:MAG: hypothetical protein MMC33_003348 [Icmadophila ericetorum]|nr:hypothetical protein [Icmadophila ericetorum]
MEQGLPLTQMLDDSYYVWPHWYACDGCESNFSSFVLQAGLDLYFIERVKSNPQSVYQKSGRPFLDYALRKNLFSHSNTISFGKDQTAKLITLRALLENGADPNEIFGSTTVWVHYLVMIRKYVNSEGDRTGLPCKERSVHWKEVIELLIKGGAAQDVQVDVGKCDSGVTFESLSDVFQAVFPREEASDLESLLSAPDPKKELAQRMNWFQRKIRSLGEALGGANKDQKQKSVGNQGH